MRTVYGILLVVLGAVAILCEAARHKTLPTAQEGRLFPEDAECTDDDRQRARNVLMNLRREELLAKGGDPLQIALMTAFEEGSLPECVTFKQIKENPNGVIWFLYRVGEVQATDV